MKIVRKGYYTITNPHGLPLLRPDGQVRRVTSRDECYERISEDGIEGKYLISCPDREVEITEVSAIITAPPAGHTASYDDTVQTGSHVYHIDPVGGDDSDDGSAANPWQSVDKVLGSFSPGDIIYLRAGTHSFGSGTHALTSSGNSSDYILLRGYPGEVARLDTTGGSFDSDGNGPVIFTGADYWWLDWLVIDTDYQSFGGQSGSNWKVTRIIQPEASSSGTDNAGLFKLNRPAVNNWLFEDCEINGYPAAQHNCAAFYMREPQQVKLRYCTLRHATGSASGPVVQYKERQSPDPVLASEHALWEYCYIDGNDAGSSRGCYEFSCNKTIFRHCIFAGEQFNDVNGGFDPLCWDNRFEHCTFYRTSGTSFMLSIKQLPSDSRSGQDNQIHNCLFDNCKIRIFPFSSPNAHNTVMDYNMYITGSAAISEYGTDYSLAGWKTQNGGDANSIAASPTYATTVSLSDPSTFALSSLSSGYQAGSDGLDMGADAANVGPRVSLPTP